MNISVSSLRVRAARWVSSVAILSLTSLAVAQRPEARILTPIDNSVRATLTGSKPHAANAANDAGRLPGDTPFQAVTIAFSRSAAQQSALDALIAAQQNPASPQYHQWLDPDTFAAEFGAADADIAKVQNWLQQQGFTVGAVSRNRGSITFSGTSAQLEAAFGTEMHYFNVNGVKHVAPASDLSIPAAFSGTVIAVANIQDFRPRAHNKKIVARGNFTEATTDQHQLTPGDVAVIYDINAAYNSGYTGNGQTIAVVGQSAVVTSDITTFQTAAGVPARAPNLYLMPNTGASTVYSGDETESDIDLEYTSSIAKNATIDFVYTGSSPYYGVFDAVGYAITNKIAPIISISYGSCETDIGSYYSYYNNYLQQAAAQGQTVIASAGDSGSIDCYGSSSDTTAEQTALTVDFPSDSQYVTGMGGTEFPATDVAATNTQYWTQATTTDIVTSALSYIPEQAWNDDYGGSQGGLSAGGGGVSVLTSRPSWQTGVPGIASGSYRLTPDISLSSSADNAGYLICSSDATSTGVSGSCASGFRSTSGSLVIYGGTSFAAPIFAGMLAIINQKEGVLYQGVINPTLYSLASNSTTYAKAFHDITSGNNGCVSGIAYAISYSPVTYGPTCPASSAGQYAAGTGYDEATGLGSVDLNNLLTAWPTLVALTGSSTTVTAATLQPPAGSEDVITFKVASISSTVTAVPTGTVSITINGSYVTSVPLVNGVATYPFTSTLIGPQVISGVYSGDTNYATSTGTVTVTVVSSSLKATTATIAPAISPAVTGTADLITITIAGTTPATPAPTGTVTLTVDNGTAVTLPLTAGSMSSTATYSFSSTVAGTHTLSVLYNGDSVYATTQNSLALIAAAPGTFVLSAPALSIADGATQTETITVTPSAGFTGNVNLALALSPTTSTIVNACYTVTTAMVSGTGAATATATIYTNENNCPGNATGLLRAGHASAATPPLPGKPLPVGIALAGLLAIGFAGRRSRKLRGLVAVALLALGGMAMSGCGSSDTTGAGISANAPDGTYTITVTGTDAATGSKTASTTFTLTIH